MRIFIGSTRAEAQLERANRLNSERRCAETSRLQAHAFTRPARDCSRFTECRISLCEERRPRRKATSGAFSLLPTRIESPFIRGLSLSISTLQVSAAGNRVDLLDEACEYVKGLPFADAFPGIDDAQRVDAVAVDISSGKVRSPSLFAKRIKLITARADCR